MRERNRQHNPVGREVLHQTNNNSETHSFCQRVEFSFISPLKLRHFPFLLKLHHPLTANKQVGNMEVITTMPLCFLFLSSHSKINRRILFPLSFVWLCTCYVYYVTRQPFSFFRKRYFFFVYLQETKNVPVCGKRNRFGCSSHLLFFPPLIFFKTLFLICVQRSSNQNMERIVSSSRR